MDLIWTNDYSVNVKELDEQHKTFMEILNRLIKAIEEKKVESELTGLIETLISHCRVHFATEEHYFKKFNYNDSENHIKEHKSFMEKINKFKETHKSREIDASFELADLLEDWLVSHSNNYDKEYTRCFNEHGLY